MPNGIDLGLTVFTQWRTQQGGGILGLQTTSSCLVSFYSLGGATLLLLPPSTNFLQLRFPLSQRVLNFLFCTVIHSTRNA